MFCKSREKTRIHRLRIHRHKAMQLSPTDFHLETALNRIREIQGLLQDGSRPFNDSLTLFEEATQHIGQCRAYLSEAEVRLQKLGQNP